MKSLYVVALAALFAAPVLADEAKGPAKPDLAKGATISAGVCAACHTSDGSRGIPTNPILQGQHADYLVKQLQEFKAGKRDNPIMKPMASMLSDDDMPALLRPTNAISGMSPWGSCEILLAEVRNLAVCSQPRPSLASSETTTGFL